MAVHLGEEIGTEGALTALSALRQLHHGNEDAQTSSEAEFMGALIDSVKDKAAPLDKVLNAVGASK